MDCKEGTILDSYQLKTCCGQGTYGSVFLAENLLTHETVALKVISKAPTALTRELNGLVNYQSVKSPNLLTVRHIGRLEDLVFYTMDPADDLGQEENGYQPATLSAILRQQGTLNPHQLQNMLNQLLDGLQALHEHGLVHRDVKPDNILMVRGQFVLGDIGLVTTSQGASLRGTPLYMSPALLTGQRSALPQDDFYALAKVVYCALTGLPVERYPHLPPELSLTDYAPYSQAMSVPCREDSPIHTADDFRALLHADTPPPIPDNAKKAANPLRWLLPLCLVFALAFRLLLLDSCVSTIEEAASHIHDTDTESLEEPPSEEQGEASEGDQEGDLEQASTPSDTKEEEPSGNLTQQPTHDADDKPEHLAPTSAR